jgi:type III restriction enzyme
MAPSLRGVPFRPLPLLCLRFGGEGEGGQADLDLAEKETLIDLAGFSLAAQAPELPGFAPETDRKPYLLDVEKGICASSRRRRRMRVNLDLVPTDVTETDLVRWLDERLRTAGVTQSERLVWLGKVLALAATRTQLFADGAGAPSQPVGRCAGRAHGRAAQRGAEDRLSNWPAGRRSEGLRQRGLCVPLRAGHVSGAAALLPGRYRFRKHYYGVIGELKRSTAEAGGSRVFLRGGARRASGRAPLGAQPAEERVLLQPADGGA